jgi:hypothetical protein
MTIEVGTLVQVRGVTAIGVVTAVRPPLFTVEWTTGSGYRYGGNYTIWDLFVVGEQS